MAVESFSSAPFAIEAWTLSYVEKRVAKMAKSAERVGGNAPRLVVGERFTKQTFSHVNDFGEKVYISREYVNVQVEGERPMLKGWKPVANLVKVGDFNVIRSSSGLDLETYAEKVNVCEHCGTKRRRNETWLFQNEETGKLKQVARTCVKDFVGMSDIDLKDLERWAKLTGEVGSPEFTTGAWAAANYTDVLTYMAATAAAVADCGWVSKGKAMECDRPATAGYACHIYNLHQNPAARPKGDTTPRITKEDFEYAAEALAWVRSKLETADSNYLLNAARACQEDVVLSKLEGIIASVVGAAYPRHCKAREEKKAAESQVSVSNHVGEIKKRQVFEGLTLDSITVRESDFGPVTNLWFTDAEGNIMHWRASGDREDAWGVGKTYNLKATVKSHWVNNRGHKVTSVSRAVVHG